MLAWIVLCEFYAVFGIVVFCLELCVHCNWHVCWSDLPSDAFFQWIIGLLAVDDLLMLCYYCSLAIDLAWMPWLCRLLCLISIWFVMYCSLILYNAWYAYNSVCHGWLRWCFAGYGLIRRNNQACHCNQAVQGKAIPMVKVWELLQGVAMPRFAPTMVSLSWCKWFGMCIVCHVRQCWNCDWMYLMVGECMTCLAR